jgi:hypothetical protein
VHAAVDDGESTVTVAEEVGGPSVCVAVPLQLVCVLPAAVFVLASPEIEDIILPDFVSGVSRLA